MHRSRPVVSNGRLRCSLFLLALLAVVWLAQIGCRTEEKPWNLVVVTIDTLRADMLGVYSGTTLSPSFDALADESLVFENAISPIGTTYPSHATLFTGLYPKRHGVRWNGDALASTHLTLAEALGDAGYETAAFVSMGGLLARGGLDQGFEVLSHPPRSDTRPFIRDGSEANSESIEWLDQRSGERPFFLWLHYAEPHSPYPLTEYAAARFAQTGYEGVLSDGVEIQRLVELVGEDSLSADDLAALSTLYQGDVVAADRTLGDIITALRARDLLDRTLLVVTADHGQALGEHGTVGEIGHGFLLWQTVLHVPLLVRVPEVGARRISDRVGLVDLAPTILDLLGLQRLPGGDGRSLLPIIEGGKMPPALYFAEVRELGNAPERIRSRVNRYAVFKDSAKLILDNGSVRSYDLTRDPSEQSPGDASLASGPYSQLLEDLVRFKQDDDSDPSAPLSESTREELRALGYLK